MLPPMIGPIASSLVTWPSQIPIAASGNEADRRERGHLYPPRNRGTRAGRDAGRVHHDERHANDYITR